MSFLSGLIGHVVSGASGGLLGILGSGLHAWLAIQQQKATIEGIKVEAGTKIRIASYRTGPIIAWAHLGVTALLLGTTLSFLWWTPDKSDIEHVVIHFTGLSLGWLLGTLPRLKGG